MRTLKFRAWHEKMGWANEVTVFGDGSWSARFGQIEGYDEADGVVLIQFTGLKDKQGKEIYEGDILLFRWPSGTGQNTYTAKIGYALHPLDDYGEALPYTGVYFLDHENGMPISGYWHPSVDQLEIIGTFTTHPNSWKGHEHGSADTP